MIDWMRYRWLYLVISGIVIISGIFSIVRWGLKFGIDFTGGTVMEYKFPDGKNQIYKYAPMDPIELEKVRESFAKQNAKEVRFENVGPTAGSELIKKTIYGLVVAAIGILLWVAVQFKS